MGVLDGHTILRFTHAYDVAGGMEQHLDVLNRILLERNRMTIIQLYLPNRSSNEQPVETTVGQGTLISIPMTPVMNKETPNTAARAGLTLSGLRPIMKKMARDHILYNPVWGPVLREIIRPAPFRKYNREPKDVRSIAQKVFNNYLPSLVVVHLAGGLGGFEIISETRDRDIPCVIMNHFSNEWLSRSGIREQVKLVKSVGGISEREVPRYVHSQFVNLSNGIDVDLFSREPLESNNGTGKSHSILLVSRLVPNKGHVDLLKTMRMLKGSGRTVSAVFAGRIDNHSFLAEIENMIDALGLKSSVKIVGKLSQSELKRYYQESEIVVLPSYNEGLGRVLIEAQSMEVPVIAYDTGGVAEALKHNISGYLVKKGDLVDLVSRLQQLLSDPDLRKVMGKNGRAFVGENFSLQHLAERHEEWYLSNMINNA